MLPRIARLSSVQIKSILQLGQSLQLPQLAMRYRSTTLQSQFAIIVPLGVDKRAVIRHRLKRLIAGALVETLPKLAYPIQAVIRVKRLEPDASQEQIHTLVTSLLTQAGRLGHGSL